MKKTPAKGYLALATALALLAGLSPAHAHGDLVKTVPGQEEVVTTPPGELRLTFTEAVELAFSEVSILGAEDRPIKTGALSLDPQDNTTIIVPIEGALAPGTYTVKWTVVSADGHKVEGSYDLNIAP